MPSRVPRARVEAAFAALGIDLQAEMAGATTYETASRRYEQLRQKAKAAFRRLAHKLHPDHGGDAAAMARVATAWETIENTSLVRRRRPPPRPRPVVRHHGGVTIIDLMRAMEQAATTGSSADSINYVVNPTATGGRVYSWTGSPTHPDDERDGTAI